jgi:hypothetical protein
VVGITLTGLTPPHLFVSSQESDSHHHKACFNDTRLVDIPFVDFVGIVDHDCLDFLFIANADCNFITISSAQTINNVSKKVALDGSLKDSWREGEWYAKK